MLTSVLNVIERRIRLGKEKLMYINSMESVLIKHSIHSQHMDKMVYITSGIRTLKVNSSNQDDSHNQW